MDNKRKRIVQKLEKLCFKRICWDAVLHGIRYSTNEQEYEKFLMLYNHKFLMALYDSSEKSILQECKTEYSRNACLNFIFNPSLTSITLQSYMDFDETVASVISQNCTNLWFLKIIQKEIGSRIVSRFFCSMEKLLVLELFQCNIEVIPVMTAVSDYLINLQYLDLKSTSADDHGIFILCGHRWPYSFFVDSESDCSFTKVCHANTTLKLVYLGLDDTEVTRVGVACALTHIPTLKNISFDNSSDLTLSSVIYDVSEQRRNLNLPGLLFQLEEIEFFQNSLDMDACLRACPNLKHLHIMFSDVASKNCDVDRIIAESVLSNLETVDIDCLNTGEIFSPHFKSFWKKVGHQLKKLCLFNFSTEHHISGDIEIIKSILKLCPSLSHFSLHNLELKIPDEDSCFPMVDFPVLQYLVNLHLELTGDTEYINEVARKLILSSHNLKEIVLQFPVNDKILFSCLRELYLPHLSEIMVEEETAEKMRKFLHRENLTIIAL